MKPRICDAMASAALRSRLVQCLMRKPSSPARRLHQFRTDEAHVQRIAAGSADYVPAARDDQRPVQVRSAALWQNYEEKASVSLIPAPRQR
jgi:hypothetical protein